MADRFRKRMARRYHRQKYEASRSTITSYANPSSRKLTSLGRSLIGQPAWPSQTTHPNILFNTSKCIKSYYHFCYFSCWISSANELFLMHNEELRVVFWLRSSTRGVDEAYPSRYGYWYDERLLFLSLLTKHLYIKRFPELSSYFCSLAHGVIRWIESSWVASEISSISTIDPSLTSQISTSPSPESCSCGFGGERHEWLINRYWLS